MEDLRLVGLSEDGARLVTEAKSGESFGLPIDERLHAALRGDRARLGQLQISIESQLRPREIQSRIRAGQTAEQVAAAAGVPLDRISRFEGPVLAERSYVAETAQGTGVRRVTDSITTPLGVLVHSRLKEHGIDPDAQEWDSWKIDEARWQVQLVYPVGERTRSASWIFDPARRTLEPADDEARWLTDEERKVPAAVTAPPRLKAVRAAPEPVQPASTDQAELDDEADEGLADDGGADDAAVDATDHADSTEQIHAADRDGQADATANAADDDSDDALDEPLRNTIRVRRPRTTPGRTGARRPAAEPVGGSALQHPDETATGAEEADAGAEPAAAPAAARGRGRRAVVPSWDEILFGAGTPPPRTDRDH
jgi:hypothetical protein